MQKRIHVTQTFLPPMEEYQNILSRAWDAGWITNRGLLVKELEHKLRAYLGVSNLLAMTNGTLPIQIAIKAFGLSGEIITTPFSYVATTSSIVWEGCKPIFVDIHPEYLTIDERKIEAAITSKTSAILATHVFGNPCAVEVIEEIARRNHLKVIYDAAHCFGVTYKGQSIFQYGDVSTCSFHATKLFHTGEGGAVMSKDTELLERIFYHHNFGHKGKEDFQGLGINGKMSELQAAMGLALLPYMDTIIEERSKLVDLYDKNLNFVGFSRLKIRDETIWNYSYYPVIFDTEEKVCAVLEALNDKNIFPRRYFYPSLNSLPYLENQSCVLSEYVAARIICLPLYAELNLTDIQRICNIINQMQ